MLLVSLFMATVSKAPFAVRFELVGVHFVSVISIAIARLTSAEVVELYAMAIARLSCLSLVGYSVISNFDSSFGIIVKKSAGFTASYVKQVRSLLKI